MILYYKQSPFRINNKFINPKYYLFIIKFKVSNITLILSILFLSLSFIFRLKKKLNNFVY